MSIKDEYSFGEFTDAFWDAGYGEAYSYQGFQTLFDLCDEYGYDLDPVAICGDFDEYDDAEEAADALGVDISDFDEGYDWDDEIIERIESETGATAVMTGGYTVIVYGA